MPLTWIACFAFTMWFVLLVKKSVRNFAGRNRSSPNMQLGQTWKELETAGSRRWNIGARNCCASWTMTRIEDSLGPGEPRNKKFMETRQSRARGRQQAGRPNRTIQPGPPPMNQRELEIIKAILSLCLESRGAGRIGGSRSFTRMSPPQLRAKNQGNAPSLSEMNRAIVLGDQRGLDRRRRIASGWPQEMENHRRRQTRSAGNVMNESAQNKTSQRGAEAAVDAAQGTSGGGPREKLMEVLRANTLRGKPNRLSKTTVGFHCSRSRRSPNSFPGNHRKRILGNANDLISQYEEFCRKQNPEWSPERVRDQCDCVSS